MIVMLCKVLISNTIGLGFTLSGLAGKTLAVGRQQSSIMVSEAGGIFVLQHFIVNNIVTIFLFSSGS